MNLAKHHVRIWRPVYSRDNNGAFRVASWTDLGTINATLTYSQGSEGILMNQQNAHYTANLHTRDLSITIKEQDRCVAEHDPETAWRVEAVLTRSMPLSGAVTITCSMSMHLPTQTGTLPGPTPDDPPEETLEVTGTLDPDITGTYTHSSEFFNGKPVYVGPAPENFVLWWHDAPLGWLLTLDTGVIFGGPRWGRFTETIEGEYSPAGGATGTATVTAPGS